MKIPIEIKGRYRVRDSNICKAWLEYLDDDDNTQKVTEFKISLAEQVGMSYRNINKILRRNGLVLKPDKDAEKLKRFWKLKMLAKGKNETEKDIVDILECQRKELEGNSPLVKIEEHTHFTNIKDLIVNAANRPRESITSPEKLER